VLATDPLRRGRIAGYAASGITGAVPYPVLCRMQGECPWMRHSRIRHRARGMVVHQDERIGRMRDQRLKNFSGVSERFVDGALADRGDLD
jgi:hypothetical protein